MKTERKRSLRSVCMYASARCSRSQCQVQQDHFPTAAQAGRDAPGASATGDNGLQAVFFIGAIEQGWQKIKQIHREDLPIVGMAAQQQIHPAILGGLLVFGPVIQQEQRQMRRGAGQDRFQRRPLAAGIIQPASQDKCILYGHCLVGKQADARLFQQRFGLSHPAGCMIVIPGDGVDAITGLQGAQLGTSLFDLLVGGPFVKKIAA